MKKLLLSHLRDSKRRQGDILNHRWLTRFMEENRISGSDMADLVDALADHGWFRKEGDKYYFTAKWI